MRRWAQDLAHCRCAVNNNNYYYYYFFWLYWVFIAACRLSLLVVSWGYSLVTTLRLLVAVASLVAQALGVQAQ